MSRVQLFLLVVLTLLPVSEALAKCADERYLIKGLVEDLQTRAPMEGAKVFVFFDDVAGEESADSSSDFSESYPDWVVASPEGQFEAACRFNTWKTMSLSGDVCSKKLQSLELLVIREGYRTKKKRYSYQEIKKEGRVRDEQGTNVITLQTIYLQPGPTASTGKTGSTD